MKGIEHEIWLDSEGLTGLCLSGAKGNGARELMQVDGAKLIHSFYASSHYDAMTIYYKYMNWGQYNTNQEKDKQLYPELSNINTH